MLYICNKKIKKNPVLNKLKIKKLNLKLFPILICFVFLFPILKENISSFGVILLGLNLVAYKIVAKDFRFIKFDDLYLTIPFWIVLCTSFFTSNIKNSLIHIQHALLFLIVPIIFLLIPNDFFSQKKISLYLSILKNTCLVITIIYFISYFNNVPLWKFNFGHYNDSNFREYFYNEFKLFKIHPTYLTSIIILCSVHSYELVLKQKKYLHLIYVFLFLTITFLLLTRLNIVLLVFSLLLMTLFRSSLNLKQRIILSVTFVVLISTLSIFTPGINRRFTEIINSFSVKPNGVTYDSTNVRKAILNCDLKLAKENWVRGIGYENLQDGLNYCYKSGYNSSFYLNHNYMTHNYYLYILISSGIFGFLFYLFYIVHLIKISFQKNMFLLYLLLANTLTICFVEDYFYRQYGVLYFNLLLMIFIRSNKSMRSSSTEGGI